MMKKMIFILLFVIVAALGAQNLYARTTVKVPTLSAPVVVELFTSQSCSSCPPADKVLSSLAENENIIALGCHVTYWNHLHWKDTASHPFCDKRQRSYSAQKGTSRVYTPQMVVNGTYEFVGSRKSLAEIALKRAATQPLKNITIKEDDKDMLEIALPDMAQGQYRIWMFGYKNELYQDIKKGENRGLEVTYTHPVQEYQAVGAWGGSTVAHTIKKPKGKIDGIAIIAQENDYGKIVAAGKITF